MPDFNFVLLYVELALAFFDRMSVVVAWCEMRQAYRQFRTNRTGALNCSTTAIRADAKRC
jgi:predicted DNA-binding transcriptional regulator YafY